jgi:hypothetical protein
MLTGAVQASQRRDLKSGKDHRRSEGQELYRTVADVLLGLLDS